MLRLFLNNAKRLAPLTLAQATKTISQAACFSSVSRTVPMLSLLPSPTLAALPKTNLLAKTLLVQQQSTRTVTKFSLIKGKRKSVGAVIKRFKRLDWGIWIRTHCGRHKKMFKKSSALKRRLRQHIFTNATQSHLLDKMVTSFWRRPKNYIDDPYEPYHQRDEYFATKSKTFKV